MNRKYNLKLDLQFNCRNTLMKFDEFDKNTSDFFLNVTRNRKEIDINNSIVTLVAIKPSKEVEAQFIEVQNNSIYGDLKPSMKDEIGKYQAIASITLEGETVNTGIFEYEITENKLLRQLNNDISTDERFTILTDMINRLNPIELSEAGRVEAENNRVQAEILREESIGNMKSDIKKLISDTKKEITDYKNTKDLEIDKALNEYKLETNKGIEDYKNAKDIEINNILSEYKTNTTNNIEEFKNAKSQELDNFKNAKNTEIDSYKKEKDLAINQYVEDKNLQINNYIAAKDRELDEYKEAKDKEIDLYKSNKDTLINNKISEVEAAKQNIISTTDDKISELDQAKTNMQNDVNSKIEEADNRILELQGFETQFEAVESKNTEQDTRLKDIEYKNKVQDTYVRGLFNENNDGRLTLEGEGNSLKLEGSKKGLVTVDKVVGDTMVNLVVSSEKSINVSHGTSAKYPFKYNLVPCKDYTVIINIYGVDASEFSRLSISPIHGSTGYTGRITKNGINIFKFNMDEGTENIDEFWVYFERRDNVNITSSNPMVKAITVLEGDYTNKPIPQQYFEGMQSTFEDCLVTQEMVDEGLEDAENLGKYKYEVEVRGKNLFDGELEAGTISNIDGSNKGSNESRSKNHIRVNSNVITITRDKGTGVVAMRFYDDNRNFIAVDYNQYTMSALSKTFTLPSGVRFIRFKSMDTDLTVKYQIEEGTVATGYGPYYSKAKAVYLNSPLLKNDELIIEDGELKHWHKRMDIVLDGTQAVDSTTVGANTIIFNMGKIGNYLNVKPLGELICDRFPFVGILYNDNAKIGIGSHNEVNFRFAFPLDANLNGDSFTQLLKENPSTVIYELAEPYKEVIDTNSFLMEIPNNATISIKSVVPVQSVKATYTANIPSVYGMDRSINTLQETSVDIIATSWDTDYRLSEVEWALEDNGILSPMLFNINTKNIKGGNTMALTKFEQAQIMILGGAYNRVTLTRQLDRYLEKKVITQLEYDELIALMDAKELVTGE